jgi:hypothetical protein
MRRTAAPRPARLSLAAASIPGRRAGRNHYAERELTIPNDHPIVRVVMKPRASLGAKRFSMDVAIWKRLAGPGDAETARPPSPQV